MQKNRRTQNPLPEGQKKKTYGENGLHQQWKDYILHNPDNYLTKKKYIKIIKEYNRNLAQGLVDGLKFKLLHLGEIYIQEVNRCFTRKSINWKATKETGVYSYYSDDTYIMIKWRKSKKPSNHSYG